MGQHETLTIRSHFKGIVVLTSLFKSSPARLRSARGETTRLRFDLTRSITLDKNIRQTSSTFEKPAWLCGALINVNYRGVKFHIFLFVSYSFCLIFKLTGVLHLIYVQY